MKHDSVLSSLTSTAHFYASMILGWRLFDSAIYPSLQIVAIPPNAIAAALPIYAMLTLSFGALAYVATRPFILLAEHLFQEIIGAMKRAIDRLDQR